MINRPFVWIVAALLVGGTGYGVATYGGRAAPVAGPAVSPGISGHPVAVELFTSQGCSSCPPADALLARLARDPKVVAITRPVTYWDRLGWTDTLAMPANTALQQGYAARRIAGAGVYTPQAVVQGIAGTVGSREANLTRLIAQHAARPEIGIAVRQGARPAVTLSGKPGTAAIVQLVGLDSSETVRIGAGENGGRDVTYVNVLRNEVRLAEWAGGSRTIEIDRSQAGGRGVDRYAVIVRQGDAGPILAARYL
jgi:hypothetical protein